MEVLPFIVEFLMTITCFGSDENACLHTHIYVAVCMISLDTTIIYLRKYARGQKFQCIQINPMYLNKVSILGTVCEIDIIIGTLCRSGHIAVCVLDMVLEEYVYAFACALESNSVLLLKSHEPKFFFYNATSAFLNSHCQHENFHYKRTQFFRISYWFIHSYWCHSNQKLRFYYVNQAS